MERIGRKKCAEDAADAGEYAGEYAGDSGDAGDA